MRDQMGNDRVRVEWLNPQAEMIEIASLHPRCRAALLAQGAVDRHQIDQRGAGAELVQAQRLLGLLQRAADNIDVERHHGLEVGDPQHEMVELLDAQHGRLPHDPVGILSLEDRPAQGRIGRIASRIALRIAGGWFSVTVRTERITPRNS